MSCESRIFVTALIRAASLGCEEEFEWVRDVGPRR